MRLKLMMKKFSLYIHFPYCLYKCHYCDFNSYAVKDISSLQKPYIQALLAELEVAQNTFSLGKLESVFLGGGTPSLFDPSVLGDLLEKIDQLIGLTPETEITLEVNPKTIEASRIRDYLSIAVNRFSIGIQSFQDKYLAPLGRLHSAEEAIQTLKLFEKEGVENFNFDLMFAFPGQTFEEFQEDLKKALHFQAKHISLYNLTLEAGTIFAEHYKQGKFKLLDSDLQAKMYEEGIRILEAGGYAQYEISNYSRPAYESKHNLSYWKYQDYLGLGAGAVSFLSQKMVRRETCHLPWEDLYGIRWMNPKSPEQYLKSAGQLYPLQNFERISFSTAQREFWMMGLRLREGILIDEFKKRFGLLSLEPYREVIQGLVNKAWLEKSENKLKLSSEGQLLANEVIASFFI